MEVVRKDVTVRELADSWNNRSLHAAPEYQRGLAWKPVQRQRFIDSVFRGYPLPLFYFRQRETAGIGGRSNVTWEIVDGQQRIQSLATFISGQWPTLDREDSKLALPAAIKTQPCPWGGRHFDDLSPDLQARLLDTEVQAVFITDVTTEHEVRDLFIRLQAGTALTRQQVRDAWPGPIGPFIERLAGKKAKRPTVRVFDMVDKRGRRNSEDAVEAADPYHDARQTCAQLMVVYFARKEGTTPPSLTARALDDLYYTNMEFDAHGPDAETFVEILEACEYVLATHEDSESKPIRKNQLFSLFNLFYDIYRARDVVVNRDVLDSVGSAFWGTDNEGEPSGRVTAQTTMEEHYDWFLREKLQDLWVPGLDRKRAFDAPQKKAIWEASLDQKGNAICGVCRRSVARSDAEFDHKIPWIRGGRTIPENGQVVHKVCHRRGRSAVDFANDE